MEDFKNLLKEYDEMLQAYENGDIKCVFTEGVESLSPKEVQLFCAALNDIYEIVKLPGNRRLMLQGIISSNGNGAIVLSGSVDVLELLKMRAILAGFMQNVKHDDLLSFALEGDSGHADLRYKMVKNVVDREKSGIDYQPYKQEETLNK